MDGVHDLGGVEGFGALVIDRSEPVFSFDWERRVFGLNFSALPGNVDKFRYAIERMGAVAYLTTAYYVHWLVAIETLALEGGVLTAADLASAHAAAAAGQAPVRRDDPDWAAALVAGVQQPPGLPAPAGSPGFSVGDTVRVRRSSPPGHTRCPRYVRGAPGTVEAIRGSFRLPDASAAGEDRSEPLYSVAFAASELWGSGDHRVVLDLWQSYLEPEPAR